MNKLIAGQSDKLNMGWVTRWPVARRLWCCVSKTHKETWLACESILQEELNLVNLALKVNGGKQFTLDGAQNTQSNVVEDNSKLELNQIN
jgi:hypothetical protein